MTRITLLRCREQAGERFRTTQTSSPHPAGTGNCLRTVKLLAPDFSGASQRAKVGKLLEAAAGRHLTRSGQRTARGMHWTQAIMLGKQNDPRGLTEELEQFLYTLNLLDCSTAAPVSRVCSRVALLRDLAELPPPAVTTWEALHAAIEAGGIQIKVCRLRTVVSVKASASSCGPAAIEVGRIQIKVPRLHTAVSHKASASSDRP